LVPKGVQVGNFFHKITQVAGISPGTMHTCLVTEPDRRGLCFGDNRNGQSYYPLAGLNLPYDLEKLKAITSGEAHACAIRGDGTAHIVCWGFNHFKQSDPVPVTPAVQLGAGDYHTCAAEKSGALRCWGWNNMGQAEVPASLGPGGTGIMTAGCDYELNSFGN